MDIKVATYLRGKSLFAGPRSVFDNSAPKVSWDESHRVTLAVTDDDLLADVLDRAAEELNLTFLDPYGSRRSGDTWFRALFHRDDHDPVRLNALLNDERLGVLAIRHEICHDWPDPSSISGRCVRGRS